MGPVTKSLLVFVGGGLGANARYWLGGAMASKLGSSFPWHTLFVNASGSLILGAFMGLSLRADWDPGWRLLVAVGLCGGYTTFSSFSFETISLIETRSYGPAIGNIVASALSCLVACWLGAAIAKGFAGG